MRDKAGKAGRKQILLDTKLKSLNLILSKRKFSIILSLRVRCYRSYFIKTKLTQLGDLVDRD